MHRTGLVITIAGAVAAASCFGAPTVTADEPPLDVADGEARVVVELLVDEGPAAIVAAVVATAATGGELIGAAPGVVLVEVPAGSADRLASDAGAVAREPVAVDVRPEILMTSVVEAFGPTTGGAEALIGADAWHDVGLTGAGVTIGVIDFFDTMYWDVDEHGPLPVAGTTARCIHLGEDCSSEFFDGLDHGGERHGVAVVEVLRDVAPDAEIVIGQATTASDYRTLIDWFDSRDVDIISRSLGSRYDGPGDGRGPLDSIASDATDRGMTWVNSGGNNGELRYYRQPARLIRTRVAFGPTGTDTYLPFRGCVQLGGIRWAADWDLPPAERTDYDAYLIEAPPGAPSTGRVVASSTANQRGGAPPLELFDHSYCPADDAGLYLELRWRGGDVSNDVIEITDYGNGIAWSTQSAYSAAVPIVDSDDPGVIAVGAIDPPGGTRLADYSSRGPTNDGREAPDIAAVSGFASTTYGGPFSGTSSATAVVAGAAALLLHAGLALPGDPLGGLVRNLTIDRGVTGIDDDYGHGQFVLPSPPTTDSVDDTPATFVPLDVPHRVLDTRPNHAIGPTDLVGELWAGEILDLPVVGAAGLPAGEVTAVAVNIVSVRPDRVSHVQALPTWRATLGEYSNLNVDQPGQTRANLAIVPVGDDGRISITSIARGHVVVDLLGWFRASPEPAAAGRFVELPTPQRVLDSRFIAPHTPLASGEVRDVSMPPGVPAGEVDALVVTITATRATHDGWVQAIPSGRPDAIGATSTLNVSPGDTVANAAIVPVGADGQIALTAFFLADGRADVIVDVTGYITSPNAPTSGSGRFVAVRPGRAFDSRLGGGELGDRSSVTVDAAPLGVAPTASGVVWNLTIVGADRPGHAIGWADGSPEPPTSLLNWSSPGAIRAASAITAVESARARFSLDDGPVDAPAPIGHLVVDVFGYFT